MSTSPSPSTEENIFSEIKSKITSLKPTIIQKQNEINSKADHFTLYDNLINKLISEKGNEIIEIQINNSVYFTKLSTLLSKKDSFFYISISKDLELNLPLQKRFFFDRDNYYFSFILDYLRTNIINLDDFSKEMLSDLKKESDFYGLNSISLIISHRLEKVMIIDFKASPKYSNCGNYSIENIQNQENIGGICVQSPYEIVFELNLSHRLKGIKLKGYSENLSYWASSNGEGSVISISEDNINFSTIGKVPSGFGSTVKEVVFNNEDSKGKYLKFKGSSYLGIGYIDFII